MMERNITYHISEDRIDRAVFIMQTIGIGKIIKEVRQVSAMYNGKTPSWVIAKVRKNKHLAEMQNKVKSEV